MSEIKDEAIPLHEKILNSPTMIGFLSFLFMVILNFSCLDNPPYWDDVIGLHNQAIWLAKHNFNIIELWQTGDDSNVYRFGILPHIYGALYYFLSAKTVHVLGHLFNMGCLALAFGVSYAILRKFKISTYVALLWCTALMCEPVMSGRIVALGQECPLVGTGILSFYFLQEKRYRLGLFFIFLAMLCKMTAGVLITAFVLWLIIDICLAGRKWREQLKTYKYYLSTGILLIAFFLFSSFYWKSELLVGLNEVSILQCFSNLAYAYLVLVPIQFAALIVMGFITLWRIIVLIKNKSLFNLSEKDKFSLLILIFTGGFWFSYGSYGCSLPRYSAFVVFPVYIFIALNTFSTKKKWLTCALAIIFLMLGFINTNGRYYLRLQSNRLRSGEYLERSREFLNDLWENQAACKLLEIEYFDRPIVAKWPFMQMLTIPEMGYVTKALPNVYAACPTVTYAKTKVYDPKVKMPDNTLYIFAFNSLDAWTKFGPSLFPKRNKRYKIILKNQIKGGWFLIYEKEPER